MPDLVAWKFPPELFYSPPRTFALPTLCPTHLPSLLFSPFLFPFFVTRSMSMTRAKAAENVRGKLTRLRFLTNRTDENLDAIVKSVDAEFYIDKISSFVELTKV